MNRRIGMVGAVVDLCAVVGFALSMLIGEVFWSYLTSMFIALGFVPMICAYSAYAAPERKAAAQTGAVFAGLYAAFILLVYFTQLTAVRNDPLGAQALMILDYRKYGLFFSLDLLGYAMMALATFFAGLTIDAQCESDRWLRGLLLIHGVFAIGCLLLPVLGVFSADMRGADFIGTWVLLFWCAYFAPVGALSALHFKKKTC